MNVHSDRYGSSFLEEVEGALVDGVPREVPVVTIDGVCAKKRFEAPYLIKVDMQGAELQVLAGAQRTLKETEAVILEVTLFGMMIGGPQLYDVVLRMKELGFVTYDVFGLHYRPLDNALSQVDMVFVQERGRFRQTHAYATPEQRRERFSSAAQSELQAGSEGVEGPLLPLVTAQSQGNVKHVVLKPIVYMSDSGWNERAMRGALNLARPAVLTCAISSR